MSRRLRGGSARNLACALFLAAAPWSNLFPATFIPGDANSSGAVNLTDAVAIFRYLYLGDGALLPCRVAADVDGNARIDLTDGIRLLGFLFLGGEPPVYPQGQLGPGCGIETPDDVLGCDLPVPCGARGIFFVLDKAGSVNEAANFRKLQTEVIRALDALSESDEFGIIFFDIGLSKFPVSGTPARASAAMKAAGKAYVMSMAPGHNSCAKPALFTALAFAGASTADLRSIVYISDGFAFCVAADPAVYQRETLAEVKARNTGNIPINTIGWGPPGAVDEAFLKRLAAENGGTFSRVVQ